MESGLKRIRSKRLGADGAGVGEGKGCKCFILFGPKRLGPNLRIVFHFV